MCVFVYFDFVRAKFFWVFLYFIIIPNPIDQHLVGCTMYIDRYANDCMDLVAGVESNFGFSQRYLLYFTHCIRFLSGKCTSTGQNK